MTTVIGFPNCNSDFDPSDTPPRPHSECKFNPKLKHSTVSNYKSEIKSKFLGLENKTTMQRSSPTKPPSNTNIFPPYPLTSTPQLIGNNSPPNLNLHTNPPNNLSPRYSQLPSLCSSAFLHILTSPDDSPFFTIPPIILSYSM